ncbi:MerR family transcriptional regulator [Nocardiopsis mangrovi]|uniref:MerR family transcriptional regulator n=1 Tax=Nocardiopsis mangrovi TaxID=1179818 RepID=A0ABV9E5L7_9ACTN
MRIGDLARRTGVSVRSLRYYEEQGLLTSTRTASGQRTYTEDDVGRVRLLRRLYDAGLTSSAIAAVLPCVDAPGAAQTDTAWERMVAEREKLDSHIGDLLHTRDALDELIAVNRHYRQALAG